MLLGGGLLFSELIAPCTIAAIEAAIPVMTMAGPGPVLGQQSVDGSKGYGEAKLVNKMIGDGSDPLRAEDVGATLKSTPALKSINAPDLSVERERVLK